MLLAEGRGREQGSVSVRGGSEKVGATTTGSVDGVCAGAACCFFLLRVVGAVSCASSVSALRLWLWLCWG